MRAAIGASSRNGALSVEEVDRLDREEIAAFLVNLAIVRNPQRLQPAPLPRRPPHEHWAHGGQTSEANLVLLCHHHHTLVHEGGYSIRRRARARLSFHRPDGKRIPHAPRRPGGSTDRLALANRRAELAIAPETAVTGWQGDHLDLPLATHLLCETRLRH